MDRVIYAVWQEGLAIPYLTASREDADRVSEESQGPQAKRWVTEIVLHAVAADPE